MSAGNTASAPYTRKNGVYPVDRFGVVLKLHSTAGSSSIQHPADLCSGSMSRGFILDNTNPLDLSTCTFDAGWATEVTSSRIFLSRQKRANAPSAKFVPLSVIILCG